MVFDPIEYPNQLSKRPSWYDARSHYRGDRGVRSVSLGNNVIRLHCRKRGGIVCCRDRFRPIPYANQTASQDAPERASIHPSSDRTFSMRFMGRQSNTGLPLTRVKSTPNATLIQLRTQGRGTPTCMDSTAFYRVRVIYKSGCFACPERSGNQ